MSEIQQSTSFTKIIGSRKVCVINMDEKPYVENFKGENITVPPLGKREVFMPYWKAANFKSSCFAPPAFDLTGDAIRGGLVKMIRVVELTDEERERFGEFTPDELAARQAEADRKTGLTCGMCGFNAENESGLRLHTTRTHPEAALVE